MCQLLNFFNLSSCDTANWHCKRLNHIGGGWQAILPALTQLLAPPFRPVAAHLQSDGERAVLEALVDTMLSYRLSYTPGAATRAAAAPGAAQAPTAALPLHPAVDQLCCYEVCPGHAVALLRLCSLCDASAVRLGLSV